MYRLTPPTSKEAWPVADRLFGRVGAPRGVSLLVTGPIVVAVQFPSQEEQAEADRVYLGGHEYEISDIDAQVLIDAGYGDCLEEI